MTHIDVNDANLYQGWVESNFTLSQVLDLVPGVWQYVEEAFRTDWELYCEEAEGTPNIKIAVKRADGIGEFREDIFVYTPKYATMDVDRLVADYYEQAGETVDHFAVLEWSWL